MERQLRGGRTGLAYSGIAMMEEFDELERLIELLVAVANANSINLYYSTSSSSVGMATQRKTCCERFGVTSNYDSASPNSLYRYPYVSSKLARKHESSSYGGLHQKFWTGLVLIALALLLEGSPVVRDSYGSRVFPGNAYVLGTLIGLRSGTISKQLEAHYPGKPSGGMLSHRAS